LAEVEFSLRKGKLLNGLISYLTWKHRGNVYDKGIVRITSKSVYSDGPGNAVRNAADPASESFFTSKNEPGQWICWDFRDRRLRPTHYAIKNYGLKSWVVESSLDGENSTEINRKTDNKDLKYGWRTASFAVSNSSECHFIRLTQTDKRHGGKDFLFIGAFEVFGTLLESRE
jgi:hypothetical protein